VGRWMLPKATRLRQRVKHDLSDDLAALPPRCTGQFREDIYRTFTSRERLSRRVVNLTAAERLVETRPL
jgi:hypothetical protein